MKNKNRSGSTVERPVLVMIGACLLVIGCTISLLVFDQKNTREEQIRARGISLVRLLAGLPSSQLDDQRANQSLLQLLSFSQGTDDFAYAAIVNTAGNPIAEVTAPGIIVPLAPVSNEPSGWIGERGLELASQQREVMEYYAPIFSEGEHAGQIRLGFYRPTYALLYEQLPGAATLALLIFMLTPLVYFLLKREIRPLAQASAEIERLMRENEPQQVTIGASPSMAAFIDRFNQFVDNAQQKIHTLEHERGELMSSAKLISYKKSRIDMTLQALPDAVLVMDEHGKINYVNQRATAMLGASKEEILSKPARQWCQQTEVAEILANYESAAAMRYSSETRVIEFTADNGSNKTLAINGYPLFSPKDATDVNGTLVVIRDATQETLAQKSRMEFVVHLGHELKTPLNTLALYSEMLLDLGDTDEAERISAVNTIHDEVERLVGLVNNLLSITRLEMGTLSLERQRVRLADFLEDIQLSLGRAATQSDIQIDVTTPKELDAVMVDKDLLRIAINNLVSNAIKYNKPGGSVSIAAEESDEAVLIRVSDTGIGIGPEDLANVFGKFYRSEHHEVRERGGHGLGLSLAQEIVQLHGGNISVESELGTGSTFTITLWKQFGLIKKAI